MKSKKINYKSILQRLKEIQVEKNKADDVIIVIAEKQQDGTYWIAQTNRDYKRKDFFLKGEDKFNNYIEKLDRENCTIIINDEIASMTDEINSRITKNCTDEELHTLIEIAEKSTDTEIIDNEKIEKIWVRNIKEIAEGKN